MNFALSDDQRMMRETFARFLDERSSPARVRAAAETGGLIPPCGRAWPNSAPLPCGSRNRRVVSAWA